jgi:hypothetical protein
MNKDDWYEELDDDQVYCVYCFDEASDDVQIHGCCGENHFLTGKQIKDNERDLDEVDKRMKGASQ